MTEQTQEKYGIELNRIFIYSRNISADILKAGFISLLATGAMHTIYSGIESLVTEQNFSETIQTLQNFKAGFIGAYCGSTFGVLLDQFRKR